MSGLLATLSWGAFWFELIEYPLYLHRYLFAHGMLIYFVSGFMLTAVPRVLKCAFPSHFEMSFILLASFVHFFSVFIEEKYHLVTAVIVLFGLLLFALRRIRFFVGRHFIVIPIALLSGISSLLLLYIYPLDPFYYSLYKDLYFYGFLLSLILSVGSFLIVKILGRKDKGLNLLQFILILGFYIGLNLKGDISNLYRTLLVYPYFAYVLLYLFEIYKLPQKRTPVSISIYISLLLMSIALAVAVYDFGYTSDLHHLLYLGAFLMITFSIAARVLVAHSEEINAVADFERGKKIYLLVTLMFLFASLTRSTVFVLSGDDVAISVMNHYFYASIFVLVGILSWGYVFIPIILRDFKKDLLGGSS
jgi:hypothetical protein